MIFALQKHPLRQKSFRSTSYYILTVLICLVFITRISYAQTSSGIESHRNNFSLQPLMQLTAATDNKNLWQKIIAHPDNAQQYFASNKQGEIYLIAQKARDGTETTASLLLDFNQLAITSNTVKTLNAFTLHPNFSIKDQQGFATFYTAHTEASNKSSPTKRIQERNAQLALAFDGVVTEWQLDLNNPSQVNLKHTREVLRITLPDASHGIKQLSFNPYIKPWHDNYALLHIAVDSTDSLNQFPLYSGAILRINPKKFGMRSFTIPDNNPFVEDQNINSSLYLVGAQHIQQFIWSDKNNESLLIAHQYQANNKQDKSTQRYQWLSFSHGGEDWRENTPKQVIYKSHKQLSNNQVLLYRGRNAPALRNKLLILQKNNNKWQLSSLNSSPQESKLSIVAPQAEWQLSQLFTASSPLQLYVNNSAEIVIFQQDIGTSFELFQNNIQVNKALDEDSNASIYSFFIIMLTFFVWYAFYQIKVKKKSAKAMVRKQYAHISLAENKEAVNLFKRHQKTIDKSISIQDISQYQVLLGDNVVSSISNDPNQGFSDQQEQTLRDAFNREHTEKMIDGKIRRISIAIIDKNKQRYTTCLYLRKGNDRITKRSYYQVIDDLIDWCWLIATKINTENTGNRKAKPKVSAAEKSKFEHKLHDETPLHKQAAIIRPVAHQQTDHNTEQVGVTDKDNAPDVEKNNEKAMNAGLIDTELVNALEKLVNLKQQGFLNAEEFAQAKAKLLKNLIA